MSRHRILLVEDDENLRVALADNLLDAGYAVLEAATIAAAREAWSAGGLGLVVLDLMLPDGDGYALCRERRAAGDATPVLMLTARGHTDELVRGFEEGADDYLTKPYRLRELMARVAALLRRARGAAPEVTRFGAWVVDRSARTVTGPDGPVSLTRREFDILLHLTDHVGVARSRDEVLDCVWGSDVVVDTRTVDNFVSNLKRKLDWSPSAGWRIRTVRGVGYRFETD